MQEDLLISIAKMNTIQVAIPKKYQTFFSDTKSNVKPMSVDSFFNKFGISEEIIKHMIYLKETKEDIKQGNYTVGDKLGRNIQ